MNKEVKSTEETPLILLRPTPCEGSVYMLFNEKATKEFGAEDYYLALLMLKEKTKQLAITLTNNAPWGDKHYCYFLHFSHKTAYIYTLGFFEQRQIKIDREFAFAPKLVKEGKSLKVLSIDLNEEIKREAESTF